jgi:hypothetical protein
VIKTRRRFIGLLAAVSVLLVALPAAQASARFMVQSYDVSDDLYQVRDNWVNTNLDDIIDFYHENGSCTWRSAGHCYAWRSSPGARNFIVYGPYITLPYGYYTACWDLENFSPGHVTPVWIQTTADNGTRYLGGSVPAVGAYLQKRVTICYWFGSGHAMGNVEFRAIMANPQSDSQVQISTVLITRYW